MAMRNGRLSLSVLDDRGGGGTFLAHVKVDDSLTIANAYAAITAFKTLMLTVSNAGVKVGEFALINEAVLTAAGSDSNVGAGAVFDFSNATDPSTYGQFIPSFLASLISADGTIDITAGANATFVTDMIGAVLGGTYTNTRYVSNGAGLDAFLSNRKRKKRVRP